MPVKKTKLKIVADFEEDELDNIVTIFKTLSDPSRLKIIAALTQTRNLCVSDLANRLSMSISRVSHHLSILQSLGFMKHKQEGKQVYYRIDDDCITDMMERAREHVRGN